MAIVMILLVAVIALRYVSIFYYCSELKKEIASARESYRGTAIAQIADVEEERVDR